LLVITIGSTSATFIALVTVPTAICSSIALSTDHGLLADATGMLSKEASAASSSSMDMLSSSVLAFATTPSSPEEASIAVASSSEATSAAIVPSSEIAFAISIQHLHLQFLLQQLQKS
jgi:hypothetical protein